jgi:WD40 repeat protein
MDLFINCANCNLQIRRVTKPLSLVTTLNRHTGMIWTLQFDKDILISGARDMRIRIWDLTTYRLISTLAGHRSDVRFLRFSEKLIVSAGDDSTVRLWDRRTSGCICTLETNSSNGWVSQFDDDKIILQWKKRISGGNSNMGFEEASNALLFDDARQDEVCDFSCV